MKHVLMTAITRLLTAMLVVLATQAQAQTIDRDILAQALGDGGFVIIMRHASSPRQLPDATTVNADNANGERQLDATGRADARAMGDALRRLDIPVTEVLSSPAYRALETARRMGFDNVTPVTALSNEGMRATSAEKAAWLQAQAAARSDAGNRLLITHAPNLAAAFPDYSNDMTEGEALIFDPRGMEGPVMIHRIRITDWPAL